MNNIALERETKTISEVAYEFNVSEATVRNWIKAKLLFSFENKGITQDSINHLAENIIGKKRLNSRANKGQKDTHNHNLLSSQIQKKITEKTGLEKIGEEYENSLSDSYKNKEGIYYTPDFIIKDMMKDFDENLSGKTFLDPCCGSGNFILEAIRKGFNPENIFGFDTDKNAVEIAKKRIFEETGYISKNIVTADFLDKSTIENRKFDYIFTNPPWGKKISKEEKQKYSKVFGAGKSTDTASLFFFASLNVLKNKGKLGFLLPDSFFNISVFENVRKKALEYQINRLIDYKKPFKGLMTKAYSIILTNLSKNNKADIQCNFENENYIRDIESFIVTPKSILNFWIKKEDSEVISQIFNIPYITLENKAQWGLGIVTGNNNEFCKSKPFKDLMPVYRGSDITKNGLKEPTAFIPKDLNLYQQVAPKSLYESKEKLIYKFISSDLCFYFDNNQNYVLNSANMIILNNDFPINGKLLCELLNSDFMNWVFKSIFNTFKILRGDLELLPIHIEFFKNRNSFNEKEYLDYLNIKKDKNGAYRIKK